MRIQSVRSTKLELSVRLENKNEVQATKLITIEDYTYLKQLREIFHNRLHKLDEKYTPSDIIDYEENSKRYKSVSVTDKYSVGDLKAVQHNKK